MGLKKLNKISDAEFEKNSISALADNPNNASIFGRGGFTAKALKEWFDLLPKILTGRYNSISDALSGEDATKYLAMDGDLATIFPDVDSVHDFFTLFAVDKTATDGIVSRIYVMHLKEKASKEEAIPLDSAFNDVAGRLVSCEKRMITDVSVGTTTSAAGATQLWFRRYDKNGSVTGEYKTTLDIYASNIANEAVTEEKIAKKAVTRDKLAAELRSAIERLEAKDDISADGFAKLKPPLSAETNSREMTLAVQNRDTAFEIKNFVYVDGRFVGSMADRELFDFSEFVEGLNSAAVEISVAGTGFSESDKISASWGRTNGDADGISYTAIHDGNAYAVSSISASGSRTVASVVNGKSVREADNVCVGTSANLFVLEKLVFLGDLDQISGFSNCNIEVMYLPNVEIASGFNNNCVIQRLYTRGKVNSDMINGVEELSPNSGMRRINTWCTGVGSDDEFEWAYKEDDTIRITYWKKIVSPSDYVTVIIPDKIDEKPVNGLGKFFAYNNLNIEGIEFGKEMEIINESAVRNCTKLKSVKFGAGLQEIGEHAFRYSGITELDLSGCQNLWKIGGRAFSNCGQLISVKLPASVRDIGSTAFASCAKLGRIYVPWKAGEVPGEPWGATGATVIHEWKE